MLIVVRVLIVEREREREQKEEEARNTCIMYNSESSSIKVVVQEGILAAGSVHQLRLLFFPFFLLRKEEGKGSG